MKELLRVTLIQTSPEWENPTENLKRLEILILPMEGITDLIILPEMFTTGFSMNVKLYAETMKGSVVGWMKKMALNLKAAIGGSIIIKEKNKYFNRFLMATPDGELTTYDKKHLFSFGGENKPFTAGRSRVIIDFLGWRIAPFICYDLRFPVWCRSIQEADLMIFSANWPDTRKEVWNILLKARAIENQLYVVGVNRTGTDGMGLNYQGESQVISPRGSKIMMQELVQNQIYQVEISKKELAEFRKKFPLAADADPFKLT